MKKLWLPYLLASLLGTSLHALAQPKKTVIDALAGRLNAYTDSLPHSSIYLKTSKDIYETLEDFWFKAYVLDAQYHTLFGSDRTLYVKLEKASRDSTVWEEKYPINNGIASGHIYLDKSLPEGNYFLTAYTAHSLYSNTSNFDALKMIRIVKDTKNLLNQKAVATADTIAPAQDIQFSLMPEGGQLVAGLVNTVAFKAVDNKGKPVDVSGQLLQANVLVQNIKSLHAGMGSFSFKPKPGSSYQVRLSSPNMGKLYSLPAIQDKGVVMHLARNINDTLCFNISQNAGSAKQPVFLRVQVRGRVQAMAAAMLGDSVNIKIPTINIPQGIAEATLFDQQMRPLVERLVYINLDKLLNISTSLSKEIYKTREKVTLAISTTDKDGKPVQANIGVNVYDKLYHNPSDAKDILTHYYLSTQLKGMIYNPGYYFNNANKNRKQALDALLLTQGWRCYLWYENELKEFKNTKQLLSDTTQGRLLRVNNKKYKPKEQLLMAFSADYSEKRPVLTDSMGRFTLAPDDFVKGRWSYLKRFDAGNEEYNVIMQDHFREIAEAGKILQYNNPIAEDTNKDNEIPRGRQNIGNINLNEVRVVAKKQSIFRDKYMGHLDSLAKLEGNGDYVCNHGVNNSENGFLNIPIGCHGNKPVEGREYTIWIGSNPPPHTHDFTFADKGNEVTTIIYHYPKFTEEELLKKFRLTRVKGYYEKREFYQPDYDKVPDPLPDYRNTLLWAPDVVTDKNGKATLTFFNSDINSRFMGTVEGVADGLLGKKEFYFNVVR